jgi:hypothetical protein
MEILWVLMALLMLSLVLLPFMRRRRGMIEQVPPGHPDAADPANYGFARQEELDVRMPGPDQDLLDVLDLVQRTQDYRAAAQLLAGTEADGELRWQRVQAFAGAASLELQQRPGNVGETPGGQWLRVWRAEQPKDAGGAAVHAEFLVQQAWRTARPGTDEFRIIMEEARAACGEAALLAPGDPVPYIVELSVARGLAYSREEFEQLWLKILDRAPNHMGAHLAALHFWCEKWHGSKELATSFAEAAAARAPQGSLLAAMPLFSVFEHLPEVNLVSGFYQSGPRRAARGPLGPRRRPDAGARTPSAGVLPGAGGALGGGHERAGPRRRPCRRPALDALAGPGGGVRGLPRAGGRGLRGERRQPGDPAALIACRTDPRQPRLIPNRPGGRRNMTLPR